MTPFSFSIRTPEETTYKNEVEWVTLSTEMGQLQLMAHHASLTGTILFSTVIAKEEKKEEQFLVRNGMVLFNNKTNTAMLLALYAERKSEISHQTAKEYLAFIEKQLREGKDLSEFQILYLEGEKLAIEQQIKVG